MPKVRSDIKDLSDYRSVKRAEEKYPWLEKLMDGKVHELEAGKDFKVATESMRSSVKAWAERHGYNVFVRAEKKNVLIQSLKAPVAKRKPAKRKAKR